MPALPRAADVRSDKRKAISLAANAGCSASRVTAAVTRDAEQPALAARLIAFLLSDRTSAALGKAGMKRP